MKTLTAITTGGIAGALALTGALVLPIAAAAPLPQSPTPTPTGSQAPSAVIRPGAAAQWLRLSGDQRQCLADLELARPTPPLSDDQRAAWRQQVAEAFASCGVTVQPRPIARLWSSLTDAQRECIDKVGLTRPLGPLSKDERAALRTKLIEVAQDCGVAVKR